jgi:hypothetical protein
VQEDIKRRPEAARGLCWLCLVLFRTLKPDDRDPRTRRKEGLDEVTSRDGTPSPSTGWAMGRRSSWCAERCATGL